MRVKNKHGENKDIEIANLDPHDLFGIVEALTNSKRMKCSASAISDVELYALSSKALVSYLPQVPRTRLMLERLMKNRSSWEEIRVDFARKFPTMNLSVSPKFQKRLSAYQLTQKMALTDREIKQRKKRSLILFKHLRDARAAYRLYIHKYLTKPPHIRKKVNQRILLF